MTHSVIGADSDPAVQRFPAAPSGCLCRSSLRPDRDHCLIEIIVDGARSRSSAMISIRLARNDPALDLIEIIADDRERAPSTHDPQRHRGGLESRSAAVSCGALVLFPTEPLHQLLTMMTRLRPRLARHEPI